MAIEWPIHCENLTMSLVVREVEFVDYSPGVAGLALFVQFEDDEVENESFLRELLEVGMVVRIWESSPD
jgi:hypothetical protein